MRCLSLVLGTLFLSSSAFADTIVAVSGSTPGSNPASVFNYTHTGNSYSLGSGTNFNQSGGYVLTDLFGSALGTTEPGDVIFADGQAIHTVETVNVTLASAVSLGSFSLWLDEGDPASILRTASEFRLYAGSTLFDDDIILDSSGTQSYVSVYDGDHIEVSGNLINAPVSANYTLEFIQNAPASVGASGLRVNEFEAFTSSSTPLPSSASAGLVLMGGFGLFKLLKLRRTATTA